MKKILTLIVETAVRKLVKVEPVKELNSLENTLKELVKALNYNNRSVFWSPIKLLIASSVITFATTYYITMHSVDKVVDLTQKNYEKQEKLAVLRLLKVSKSDVEKAIDDIDRIGKTEFNTNDSQGCLVSHWSDSNPTSPYPTIFADVITDQRVILSLSDTNLPILYSYEKKLEASLDTIKRMRYESPILTKETNYANYREELKILQLTLSDEIKYQKNKLSEKQLAKASENFKSEARKDSPFKNYFDFNNGGENKSLSKQ